MFKNKTLSTLLFVFCAAALLVNAASAQSSRPYTFYIAPNFAGVVAPEKATDYYSFGYGISVGIEYPVSPQWSFVGNLNFSFFSPDEGLIADWWTEEGEYPGATNIQVSSGRLDAFTISFLSKGALRQEDTRTYPYVKGGFGISVGGAETIEVTWASGYDGSPQSDEQLGLDTAAHLAILLGLGFETRLGAEANTALFFEVGLQMVLQEVEGGSSNILVIPGTVGFRF